MCNISKPTQLKTITVYKIVYKAEGKYFGLYSHMPVVLGTVPKIDNSTEIELKVKAILGRKLSFWGSGWAGHNPLMPGKISGFAKRSVAKQLIECTSERPIEEATSIIIIKIKLGGTILMGTSENISNGININHITYAGTEILSIEEI